MPIKPENRHRYPKNWKEISNRIRFERANNACEKCGVYNYSVVKKQTVKYRGIVARLDSYSQAKELADVLSGLYNGKPQFIVIVLTVAHLDHNPENNSEENLMALCQECHNRYDAGHRSRTRAESSVKVIEV